MFLALVSHFKLTGRVIGKSSLVGDKNSRILAAVRRWNLLQRITIHTIGLGEGISKRFLKKLATQNGGQFVHEL